MQIREKLNNIALKKGFEPTAENIFEMIKHEPSLKIYGHNKRRRYITFKRVVKIEDIFVEFMDYENLGDESAFDTREELHLFFEYLREVFPKKVEILDYVYEESI